MELSTSTSIAVHDFALSILIVLSDIIFRWVPAIAAAITGTPASLVTLPSADLANSAHTAALTGSTALGQATQVALDATRFDASGAATTLPSSGSVATGTIGAAPDAGTTGGIITSFGGDTLHLAWSIFAPISIFASLVIAMILVYALIRFFQIRFAEKQALHAMAHVPAAEALAVSQTPAAKRLGADQMRWSRIEEQIVSESENDWRLAILEADIMLGEALTAKGFVGDSIGEQLKGLVKGDLATLDEAWDAHKVRNHIAHRGTMHDINQREAKRVIAEYQDVFRELGII
jgi:hypothetical protein